MRIKIVTVVLGAAIALGSAPAMAGCGQAQASDPLTGTSWELVSIESMAPEEQPSTTIDDPGKYTVAFGEDGRAVFTVDCNRGNSSWQAESAAPDSGSLQFGPIALTRMFCPQPSSDATVAAALGRVRSYLLADAQLHLSLEADSGIMHWRPAPS
jgi:heat shock protein HslJ